MIEISSHSTFEAICNHCFQRSFITQINVSKHFRSIFGSVVSWRIFSSRKTVQQKVEKTSDEKLLTKIERNTKPTKLSNMHRWKKLEIKSQLVSSWNQRKNWSRVCRKVICKNFKFSFWLRLAFDMFKHHLQILNHVFLNGYEDLNNLKYKSAAI